MTTKQTKKALENAGKFIQKALDALDADKNDKVYDYTCQADAVLYWLISDYDKP